MSKSLNRRALLISTAALPFAALATDEGALAARIAGGGAVIAFRHAIAPGTFDPPEFRLGDCSTQRNLDAHGRAQARRIGGWFRANRLEPAIVRSSPWCRCLETARLAFGRADHWAALGSPRAGSETTNEAALDELRRALSKATSESGRFEAWVTHQFVLSALAGVSSGSGEGVILEAGTDGVPRVVGRLVIA